MEDLRKMVRKALATTIDMRRSCLVDDDDIGAKAIDGPVTEDEIDHFIFVNPLFENHVKELLLDPGVLGFDNKRFQLEEDWLQEFEDGLTWVDIQDWYAGDDMAGDVVLGGYQSYREARQQFAVSNPSPDFVGSIIHSPSLILIGQELIRRGHELNELDPRRFEELVAELLKRDGWKVLLTPYTKDKGVDVIATRTIPFIGTFKTVWQAKRKSSREGKVGLSTIREFATAVGDFEANKGVVVTTGRLTRGALEYVEQKSYLLGKAEADEVDDWVMGKIKLSL